MEQHGPHVHFSSSDLLFCGLDNIIAWGIAAMLGGTFSTFTVGICIGRIGQSALASNRFVKAGMVSGQGMSSLTWKTGALGVTSSCGGLQLGAEGFYSTWGLPLNHPHAKLYTVTRMDVEADNIIGIWVDVVKLITVGVGIGLMRADVVGVIGKGWAITLTLYLHFACTLVLLFFSAILGPGVFLVKF